MALGKKRASPEKRAAGKDSATRKKGATGKKRAMSDNFRVEAREYLSGAPTPEQVAKVLRASEDEAFQPRHGRTDFYRYLEGVYEAYLYWKDAGQLKASCAVLERRWKITRRANHKSMHILVQATSQQEVAMRNRWVQALRYMVLNRDEVEEEGFRSFLKRNGGINGCSEEMGAVNKRRKKRRAKVAGGTKSSRRPLRSC
jgi:hypothetical protein